MSFYTIRRIAFKEEKQGRTRSHSHLLLYLATVKSHLGRGHGGQFEVPLIDPSPLQIPSESLGGLLHRHDTEGERRSFIRRWPNTSFRVLRPQINDRIPLIDPRSRGLSKVAIARPSAWRRRLPVRPSTSAASARDQLSRRNPGCRWVVHPRNNDTGYSCSVLDRTTTTRYSTPCCLATSVQSGVVPASASQIHHTLDAKGKPLVDSLAKRLSQPILRLRRKSRRSLRSRPVT